MTFHEIYIMFCSHIVPCCMYIFASIHWLRNLINTGLSFSEGLSLQVSIDYLIFFFNCKTGTMLDIHLRIFLNSVMCLKFDIAWTSNWYLLAFLLSKFIHCIFFHDSCIKLFLLSKISFTFILNICVVVMLPCFQSFN